MELRESVTVDICRYKNKKSYLLKTVFSHSGARFMVLFRLIQKFNRNHPLGIIFRLWYKILATKAGVEIPHMCNIGYGLYMGHFKGIIVNQNAIIGKNCNISQGVTIGRVSRGRNKGSPTIGDRVLIGPNSVVVGNIKIGNDVLIAPLTFVNFDVPPNSVVSGNPAKVVSQNGSGGYIKKIYKG